MNQSHGVNRRSGRAGASGRSVAACAAAIATSVGLAASVGQQQPDLWQQVQRYCQTSWRNAGIDPQDWSDCTQDAVLILLERIAHEKVGVAMADEASAERQELKRAVWRTIQRWRRARRGREVEVAEMPDTHCDQASYEDREWLSQACKQLSPRQRRIVSLWSEGWSIAEIAGRLQIPAARASDEKYKALRKLRRLAACTMG